MAFDWIFGPRAEPSGFAPLRNLTLDIETAPDLAAHLQGIIAKDMPSPEGVAGVPYTRYEILGREIPVENLSNLGVPDRNRLEMSTGVRYAPNRHFDKEMGMPTYGVRVYFSNAHVVFDGMPGEDGPFLEKLRHSAIDYLYQHGSQRPDWYRVRALAAFAPILLAIACWLWLVLGYDLPLPASLLILTAIVAGTVPVAGWVRRKNRTRDFPEHSIRFRGESRATTYGRRADHRRDLLIVGATFVGTVVVALVGAAATGFFTYVFAP